VGVPTGAEDNNGAPGGFGDEVQGTGAAYYRGDGDWSSDERRKGQRGGLGSGLIGGERLRRGRKGAGHSGEILAPSK